MKYDIYYTNRFKRQYKKLNGEIKDNIIDSIKKLQTEPFYSSLHTEKIKGTNFYSSRVMKAAAGIMVLVCLGIVFNSVWNLGQQETPQAHLTMNKESEVKLVFSSQQDLENVTLTLKTPEGVDIPGYENQRKIAWQTDLKQGRNVLELPVIARDKNGGPLTASIDYGDKSKEFNLLLKVGQETEDANTGSLEKEKMRQYKLS